MVQLHRPRKTLEDFQALGVGVLAELIDGEIYVNPAPQIPHQTLVGRLYLALAPGVRERRLGTLLLSPMDVHLPTGDIVQPDLVFVAEANSGVLERWVHGQPDLLIEIVSPSHPERDRIVKREIYGRSGVAEYWIVELEDRAVQVLRLGGGRYEPAGYFRPGAILRSAALPGVDVDVARLFEGT